MVHHDGITNAATFQKEVQADFRVVQVPPQLRRLEFARTTPSGLLFKEQQLGQSEVTTTSSSEIQVLGGKIGKMMTGPSLFGKFPLLSRAISTLLVLQSPLMNCKAAGMPSFTLCLRLSIHD